MRTCICRWKRPDGYGRGSFAEAQKRMALGRYGFQPGEGLYTNMNAIRRDEITDNIHSIYVDQWDWERIIDKSERNIDTLKEINSLHSDDIHEGQYLTVVYYEAL